MRQHVISLTLATVIAASAGIVAALVLVLTGAIGLSVESRLMARDDGQSGGQGTFTFALAAARKYRAVMVIVQANPNFELPASDPQRSGFNDFLAALQTATISYGKPVVLVHGDSHYFRIDKPMIGARSGRRVEKFTRVETFGETDNHWLHVAVKPNSPNVFLFDQRIVKANLIAQ